LRFYKSVSLLSGKVSRELAPKKFSGNLDLNRVLTCAEDTNRIIDECLIMAIRSTALLSRTPTACDGEVSRPTSAQQQLLWPVPNMTIQSAKLSAESSNIA
jgi:hypothetical protein